ncbi:MAG: hypothetical protein HY737_04745 [Candidatus Omnitrophica bacterium]|nr:hypothetical protein [Candidatus Omnitrophota bacterium]
MSPDGPTSPPPEEKLLHLIRRQVRPGPRSGAAAAEGESAAPSRPATVFMPQVIVQRLALSWSSVAVWALGAILISEVIWLVAQAIRPAPPITLPPSPSPSASAPQAAAADDMPSIAASASPALFQAPSAAPASGAASKGLPSGAARQLASRLSLMGLVAGNPPQAIIEDGQTKKTYFVTTGQAVVDGAVLESVSENHVTLDLDGEKIELNL